MRWQDNDFLWAGLCLLLLIALLASPCLLKAQESVLEWDVVVIADTKAARGFQFFEQGDIIAYKPAGWDWGKEERRLYSIFRIKATKSQIQELVQPVEVVVGEQDSFDLEGNPVMEPVVERIKERRYGLAISTVDPEKALELAPQPDGLSASGLIDKAVTDEN